MKFIELHLPIEAGKHNMHTDSEELSDSVSFADGRPVDWKCCCVVSFLFFSIRANLATYLVSVLTGSLCVCMCVC